MNFRQHIPNFVDGVEPFILQNVTTEELLNDKRISDWRTYFPSVTNFKFCFGDYHSEKYPYLLMCEFINKDKPEWYVLGYLTEKPKGLDQWTCPEDDDEKEEEVEVISQDSAFASYAKELLSEAFQKIRGEE